MTVLCTNSGITYADIASAIAGESGNVYLDRKEYIQSGMSTAAANFTPADHPLSFLYTAADGELVTSGDINSGAGTNSVITSTVDGGEITGVRTGALNVLSSNNAKLRRVIVNAGNGSTDGIAFNDTLDAEDVLIHNCNDGFLSSVVRLNSSIVRCTVVGATRFGFAQGKFTDCVDVNSSNQGYFNEAAGSSGTWENDGTGTDTITESPATDIFVDYAGGDYSIKADSSPGLAGAGAFINSGGGGLSLTVTETKSSSLNNSSIEILANLSIIVTETKSPSINSSLLAISSQGVTLAVTEMKSSSIDSAVIDITSNISALVTEVKSSRADFSATQIQRDIESIVTEVRASSADSSILNIPVTITISKKNMVRVKRETKTVRVSRNNKIIRVR